MPHSSCISEYEKVSTIKWRVKITSSSLGCNFFPPSFFFRLTTKCTSRYFIPIVVMKIMSQRSVKLLISIQNITSNALLY